MPSSFSRYFNPGDLPEPKEYDLEEEEGLIGEARDREGQFRIPLFEIDEAVGNRKLIGDYGYWFVNYG